MHQLYYNCITFKRKWTKKRILRLIINATNNISKKKLIIDLYRHNRVSELLYNTVLMLLYAISYDLTSY